MLPLTDTHASRFVTVHKWPLLDSHSLQLRGRSCTINTSNDWCCTDSPVFPVLRFYQPLHLQQIWHPAKLLERFWRNKCNINVAHHEGTGGLYWRLRGKEKQSCPKVPQTEHNRRGSKGNLWAFGVGSRMVICGEICHHAFGAYTHTAHYAGFGYAAISPFFLSLLPVAKTNLITGLSMWWGPNWLLRSQGTVPDRCRLILWPRSADGFDPVGSKSSGLVGQSH